MLSTKVVCGIASIEERKDLLSYTINSLYDQVDLMHVVLNGYTKIPKLKSYEKINFILGDNSKGAAMKFAGLEECDSYYFTADDDLIYPMNYVRIMLKTIKRYGNNTLVTAHGGNLKKHPLPNAKGILKPKYRYYDNVKEHKRVMWGGTGCMAFYQPNIKMSMDDMEYYNLVDLSVFQKCQKEKIPIIVNAHPKDWIKYQHAAYKTPNLYRYNGTHVAKQEQIMSIINSMPTPKVY